jgi:hypothetical protein
VLTLSADGNRLDGFGDGWFLSHTNLNMQRVAAKASSARTPSAQTASFQYPLSLPLDRDYFLNGLGIPAVKDQVDEEHRYQDHTKCADNRRAGRQIKRYGKIHP